MKKSIAILTILIGFGVLGPGLGHAQEVEFKTGIHMDWWRSPNDDEGVQTYFPIISGIRYQDFAFKVIAGGAYTHFLSDRSPDSSLGAMLDTKVNLSYEFTRKCPVDILVALDLNLPTGTTGLDQKEVRLIMDPDLVSVTSLGEGFNINPSVIFSRQWGDKWVTGVGFGYNFRGNYDFSRYEYLSGDQVRRYSPGDIFSIVPEVRYYFTEQWMSRLYGNFSTYGKSKINGEDFADQGDFYLIGAGLTHTRKCWSGGLNLYGIIRAKDQIHSLQLPAYSDEIVADLSFSYFLNEKTTLKSQARYLWMNDNGEPADSWLYWGQRNYFALGLGIARKLTANIEAECGVKGISMHDDPNWNHSGSDQSYFGMAGQIMLTGIF